MMTNNNLLINNNNQENDKIIHDDDDVHHQIKDNEDDNEQQLEQQEGRMMTIEQQQQQQQYNSTQQNISCYNPKKVKLVVDRYWLQKLLHKYCPYPNVNPNQKLIAYVLAPMVDQSDLPFRLLCRKYGSNICFTPMIHSKLYCTVPSYRTKFHIKALNADRPLIVQLCGYDPYYMIRTALEISHLCDGIDINCGCPQNIAKRGMYGAYLLEQSNILLHLIEQMTYYISIPITIKLRLLPSHFNYQLEKLPAYVEQQPLSLCPNNSHRDNINNNQNNNQNKEEKKMDDNVTCCNGEVIDEEDEYNKEYNNPDDHNLDKKKKQQEQLQKEVTNNDDDNGLLHYDRNIAIQKSFELYHNIVNLGIHMITIHGRTRNHKGVNTGHADWDAIKQIVDTFGNTIPIIANGSIGNQNDIIQCLKQTGVDGIMSSEAILEYPPLFYGMYENDCCNNTTTSNNNDESKAEVTTIITNDTQQKEIDVGTDIIDNINDNKDDINNKYYYGPKKLYIGRIQLCYEYLDLATQYPPDIGGQGSGGVKTIKIHLHRFLHYDLQKDYGQTVRNKLINATSMKTLYECVNDMEHIHQQLNINSNLDIPNVNDTWYMRYRQLVRDKYTGITMTNAQYRKEHDGHLISTMEEIINSDAADCFANLFNTGDDEDE